ncbi:MAG: hypothetical protein QOG30_35 [Acidimicrobiaceae bacterium]
MPRVAIVVGLVLACSVAVIGFLFLTAWALDSNNAEAAVGRVTSIQPTPSGQARELCVTEDSGRIECGAATVNFFEIGHVEVGDCVRVKVVRGALKELFHVPCAASG